MSELTIKELLHIWKSWPEIIGRFYSDFKGNQDSVSFGRFLTTLIDQEIQFAEYLKENLNKLNLENDFGEKTNDLFDFKMLDDLIETSEGLSKLDFLKKSIIFHEISISNCKILENIAATGSSQQIFKELSSELSRYMVLLKDRLELEELF